MTNPTNTDTCKRRRRVYVCHPYRNAPTANAKRVSEICDVLSATGHLPIAPQIYLPHFIDELTQRAEALDLCLALLDACDELRVYSPWISEGMRLEIEHAEAHGIPVKYPFGRGCP